MAHISPEVVRRANAGIFTPLQMTRGLPDQLQGAYFTPAPGGFLVAERLRRRCRFTPLNLAQPFPQLPKFDVVLCRNVLIYFDADVRRSILVSIRKALAPEGRLFLGGAESAPGVDIGFRPIRIGARRSGCCRSSAAMTRKWCAWA